MAHMYVAIDYGLKRVGIACGELEIGVAVPRAPIIRRQSVDFLAAIESIIGDLAACAAVVGLPLNADGSDSKWTLLVRKFASILEKELSLPVYFSDEYCTSRQVSEELPAGRSGRRAAIIRRRSGVDDSSTAALILQDFFNEYSPALCRCDPHCPSKIVPFDSAGPSKIYAVDFEGNGRDGVLEFGVICLDCGNLRDPLGSFCRCSRGEEIFLSRKKIPIHSTATAPPIDAFFQNFRSMRSGGILAAHHAPTEDFLIRRLWPTPGYVPDWNRPGAATLSWGPWIDSHLLARKLWPGLNSYALDAVLVALDLDGQWKKMGQKFCSPGRNGHHCALYDAIGCALIVDKCLAANGGSPIDLLRVAGGQRQLCFSEIQ